MKDIILIILLIVIGGITGFFLSRVWDLFQPLPKVDYLKHVENMQKIHNETWKKK